MKLSCNVSCKNTNLSRALFQLIKKIFQKLKGLKLKDTENSLTI